MNKSQVERLRYVEETVRDIQSFCGSTMGPDEFLTVADLTYTAIKKLSQVGKYCIDRHQALTRRAGSDRPGWRRRPCRDARRNCRRPASGTER